ncbi:MAG: hypothetical protein OHK0039_42450 [Bacteroidia bacterium]
MIQQELAEILTFEHRPATSGMLTVSKVHVTADLSLAKVHVTIFPDAQLQAAVGELETQKWTLRHALAARIRNKVRKIPELQFYADDAFAHADHINRLISEIDIPPAPDDADEEASA